MPNKMVEGDRKRDFYKAAHIHYYLESQEYNIIFLDEFHKSMRSENIYNWSPRGVSSIVAVDPDPWSLSFIIAFSKTRIDGILGSNYVCLAILKIKQIDWFSNQWASILLQFNF